MFRFHFELLNILTITKLQRSSDQGSESFCYYPVNLVLTVNSKPDEITFGYGIDGASIPR